MGELEPSKLDNFRGDCCLQNSNGDESKVGTPLWNMKQFGSSNHLMWSSFFAYRGSTPKRAFFVASNVNMSFFSFTISCKLKYHELIKLNEM